MDDHLRAKGETVRREVLGDGYVDRAIGAATAFSSPFQDVLNEYCWGMVWSDDALDRKQRSLINLGMLAALGRMQEFRTHYRGAIRNGATQEELRAAIVQIAVYCGVPAGVEAFRAANEVNADMAGESAAGSGPE